MAEQQAIPTSKRPIGFWIKAADHALDRGIDAVHAQSGSTRRRWQVLSLVVQVEPLGRRDFAEQFAPMLERELVYEEISLLILQQLVVEEDSLLTTTQAGKERHNELAVRQAAFRSKAMAGICEADYLTAVRTPARIVANSAAAESVPAALSAASLVAMQPFCLHEPAEHRGDRTE